MMKKPFCVILNLSFALLIVLLPACSKDELSINPPKMWGQLKQGDYMVGFKTVYVYDASRPSIPYSDWDGKLFPTDENRGRQMQINIWYPSKVTAKSKRLSYEHYVNLIAQQTDFKELDAQMKGFANLQFLKKIKAIGGDETFTQASLDCLKNLKTHAFLEAEGVDGKFPLIVFPNGTSPAFQSIMCEYLASHGFVVGAVGLKGEHAYTEDISPRGVEMAVIDLNFAILNLLELPQVNKEIIGLIGNAITSSQIIAYQNRNSNVDCIVSLEGGLLSRFEQNILEKTPFYDINSVDVPILAIYAPHPAIDPVHVFNLKYSERYFFHFPQMTEMHFLNFGQFEQISPQIIGTHEGDVQKGYELASLYTLKFLKAFLTNDQKSKEFLEGGIPEDNIAHIDTSFVRMALPKVPDITTIKNAYNSSGFEYIDSLYQEHKKIDTAPFSQTFYVVMKDWLAWQKDPEFKNRYELYKLAYDSYPNSAEVNYYLSYFALQTKHLEETKFHIRKASEILEKKGDPKLTIARTEEIKGNLKRFLSAANK